MTNVVKFPILARRNAASDLGRHDLCIAIERLVDHATQNGFGPFQRSADIIIFPGVRIERHQTAPQFDHLAQFGSDFDASLEPDLPA